MVNCRRPVARFDTQPDVGDLRVGVVCRGLGDFDRADITAAATHHHVKARRQPVTGSFVDRHRDIPAVGSVGTRNQDGRDRQIKPRKLPGGIEGGIAERFVDKLFFVVDRDRTRVG